MADQRYISGSDSESHEVLYTQPEPADLLRPTILKFPTCPQCGQRYRLGESTCTGCGLVYEDKLKIKPRDTVTVSPRKCDSCGESCLPTALSCTRCGTILSPQTNRFTEDTHDYSEELSNTNKKTITSIGAAPWDTTILKFSIEGEELLVSIEEAILVGRMHGWDGEHRIIDLSPFGAYEKGVSRRHLRIRRRGTLIYVADLGSSNGTWLNGQRLVPDGDRLLRYDDELRLSHLIVQVKYHSENT
jgi:hypothetical protein